MNVSSFLKFLAGPGCFLMAASVLPNEIYAANNDSLAAWKTKLSVRPVVTPSDQHTMHAYYLTRPESPDGRKVLFYSSTTKSGEHGDLVVLDRISGQQTVVARDIDTEDAHRAACQQWVANGTKIAYHDVKGGRWSVHVIDVATLQDRRVLEDRQLGFGSGNDDLVPVYGCHWKPGDHHDLEMLNTRTGDVRIAVLFSDVQSRYSDWMRKKFKDPVESIFFPVVSPDGKRAFFKVSAPGPEGAKNNYRSELASRREGKFVYDLATGQPVCMLDQWGHPAWCPDSRNILEVGAMINDVENNGASRAILGVPKLSASHQSMSPDGRLFVMDGPLKGLQGALAGQWGVVLCDARGGDFVILHRFMNNEGAASWRKNHPHPIFSADGDRIYFNVNEGPWTRLYVAQAGG